MARLRTPYIAERNLYGVGVTLLLLLFAKKRFVKSTLFINVLFPDTMPYKFCLQLSVQPIFWLLGILFILLNSVARHYRIAQCLL